MLCAEFLIKNSYELVSIITCTLCLLENLLTKNNINPVRESYRFCVLEICLDYNYFACNNIIYSLKEGYIIGNPLSPLLAKIFMYEIEISQE